MPKTYKPVMSKVKKNLQGTAFKNVRPSTRKNKKIMADYKGQIVHAGHSLYSDFTIHEDPKRRAAYCARSGGIKNSSLPNKLARKGLWSC